jgi:hypothetical protein
MLKHWSVGQPHVDLGQGTAEWHFEEVNYGDLDMERRLHDAMIPYDKEWGSGYDFGPGDEYGRIDNTGEYRVLTLDYMQLGKETAGIMESANHAAFLALIAQWRPCFKQPVGQCRRTTL